MGVWLISLAMMIQVFLGIASQYHFRVSKEKPPTWTEVVLFFYGISTLIALIGILIQEKII